MSKPSKTPGICRIDQPSHRTHGFFVRLHSRRKIYSAFFADKKNGGRRKAFAAAQAQYRKLRAKVGLPRKESRRWWAEITRRKGRSGIQGVQWGIRRNGRKTWKYWQATWSPKPYVVRRRQFSVQKHGARKARLLAIRARRAGLKNMK
jgi:hypothetical protein